MINLDALQKEVLIDTSDVSRETILKLIEVARAARLAWIFMDMVEPNSKRTEALFKVLEGIES